MGALIGAITFLRSPLGRALGLALIAVTALGYAYIKGARDAGERCEAEALRARIVILERDLQIAKDAERLAIEQEAAAEARERELNERLKRYETSLGSTPDVCLLTPSDADGLRDLTR